MQGDVYKVLLLISTSTVRNAGAITPCPPPVRNPPDAGSVSVHYRVISKLPINFIRCSQDSPGRLNNIDFIIYKINVVRSRALSTEGAVAFILKGTSKLYSVPLYASLPGPNGLIDDRWDGLKKRLTCAN